MKAAFERSPVNTMEKSSHAFCLVNFVYSLDDLVIPDSFALNSGLESVQRCRDGSDNC